MILILKIIKLPNKLALGKNNNNRSALKKNNNDNKINRFSDSGNDIKYTKKLKKPKNQKLCKLGKLKSEKLFKFQNLAKLKKKLLKSGNLLNFNTKKTDPSFLTFDNKIIFNNL